MHKKKEFREIKGDNTLFPWEMAFIGYLRQEKLYSLNHEKVKEYFPLDHVLNGVFACYSKVILCEKVVFVCLIDSFPPSFWEFDSKEIMRQRLLLGMLMSRFVVWFSCWSF